MNGNGDLRQKIDDARRRRLPMPELMAKLGLAEHAKKSARCPLPGHDDRHPSFSVFEGKDGFWFWKCHAGCGEGDEILFLSKLKGLSLTKAMNLYLDMADFPSSRPPKSHEYPEPRECPASRKSPECHEYPESLESPVFPVSNGQGLDGEKEKVLKAFAARNTCTERSTARKRRWQLVRDLRALEKGISRALEIAELVIAFDEWHRRSQPFLDPAKTRDDYLAAFLAELRKVRVPMGEGATLNKALEAVSKLSAFELPVVPAYLGAPESWRRLTALHRELSRLCSNGKYFLSYRDAAKVCDGLSHQQAHTITFALASVGVIEIVSNGKASLNSREAAKFRYLLWETESAEADDDEIPV